MKKIVSIWLILVLILSICACGKSPEEKWQEQYELGMKYVSEGNYEEAILAFTAAIEIDPKSADLFMKRGGAYLALEASEENLTLAAADLETAVELGLDLDDPEEAERLETAYETLIDGWIAIEDWERAIEALEAGLSAGKDYYGFLEDKREELELDNWNGRMAWNASDVWTGIAVRKPGSHDNYYLTDTERENIFRPLLSKCRFWMERFLALATEETEEGWKESYETAAEDCGRCMAVLYYTLGELDEAVEVRRELYERFGDERYNPNGYTEDDGVSYNGSGAMTASGGNSFKEYDGRGRVVRVVWSYSEEEYAYDADGRIARFTSFREGEYRGEWNYEYADGNVVIKVYDSAGNYAGSYICTLDAYGFEEGMEWTE